MSKKKKSFAEMKKEAIFKRQERGSLQSKAPEEAIQQIHDKSEFNVSAHTEEFPLPIKNISIYSENLLSAHQNPFIVCAFFTPNEMRYFKFAQRLLTSCEKFGLPYCIYQVSDIHRSINVNGCDDLAFTKANFIAYNIARFPDKNILYLDCDVLFVEYPEMIVQISRDGYDFAIYNLFSDESNEFYSPVTEEVEGKIVISDFHVYSKHIEYYCTNQLMSCGGVQFYKNCSESKNFLKAWQNVISQNPLCADDECLDYAYNNLDFTLIKLHPAWLDKSYLRLPWWPHVRPIILHPGVPEAGVRHIHLANRFYPEKCKKRASHLSSSPDSLPFFWEKTMVPLLEAYTFIIARDDNIKKAENKLKGLQKKVIAGYVIDTKDKLLIKIKNSEVIDVQKINQDFWIYNEDIE
jgi:hypothetical protein